MTHADTNTKYDLKKRDKIFTVFSDSSRNDQIELNVSNYFCLSYANLESETLATKSYVLILD